MAQALVVLSVCDNGSVAVVIVIVVVAIVSLSSVPSHRRYPPSAHSSHKGPVRRIPPLRGAIRIVKRLELARQRGGVYIIMRR